MTQQTVLVTSRSFSSGDRDVRGRLEAAGVRLVQGPHNHDLQTLRPLLADATAWIAGAGPVTKDHLNAAPRLQLIARYGVGVDAVDLVAAHDRGVLVTNTPGANSGAVADHTLALMLAALRQVTSADRAVRRGAWDVRRTRELGSLTVGIVGVGRIGRGVAARLAGFGSTVLGCDPWTDEETMRAAGMEPASLDALATRADIVSLHAPGHAPLINREWLAKVASQLILINTARSNLVDEGAVAEALIAGRLQFYASDTLSGESCSLSPLLDPQLADRTTFTPHSAAQTVEAVDQMSLSAGAAVLALLSGETPEHVVPPVRAQPVGGQPVERQATADAPRDLETV